MLHLPNWEPTIEKIVHEYNHEPNVARKHRLLTEWRTKLAKEPTLLQPFQIDQIVREVRQRLGNPDR